MARYDGPRYDVPQILSLQCATAQDSQVAAATVVARHTWMHAVKVTDWNLRILKGDVLTGTAGGASWGIVLGKSLGGTGSVSVVGTAELSASLQGGTYADHSILDRTCAETSFAVGDDIVLQFSAGTALPTGDLQIGADVRYIETFVATD